jgi:hypothetical protein
MYHNSLPFFNFSYLLLLYLYSISDGSTEFKEDSYGKNSEFLRDIHDNDNSCNLKVPVCSKELFRKYTLVIFLAVFDLEKDFFRT